MSSYHRLGATIALVFLVFGSLALKASSQTPVGSGEVVNDNVSHVNSIPNLKTSVAVAVAEKRTATTITIEAKTQIADVKLFSQSRMRIAEIFLKNGASVRRGDRFVVLQRSRDDYGIAYQLTKEIDEARSTHDRLLQVRPERKSAVEDLSNHSPYTRDLHEMQAKAQLHNLDSEIKYQAARIQTLTAELNGLSQGRDLEAVLNASMTGTIIFTKPLETGTVLNAGEQCATITSPVWMKIVGPVPPNGDAALQMHSAYFPESPCTVSIIRNDGTKKYAGVVRRVQRPKSKSRYYQPAEFLGFVHGKGELPENQSVTVEIPVSAIPIVIVPKTAVIESGNRRFVIRRTGKDSAKLEIRAVEVLRSDATSAIVRSIATLADAAQGGKLLSEGDEVVSENAALLMTQFERRLK